MSEELLQRPAWYVIGPLIGLIVVAMAATINRRIGVTGGFSNVVERATGRVGELDARWWFLGGAIGGALIWRIGAGESTVGNGYGYLTREFSDDAIVAAILFGGGIMVGFGAKMAGGCTSGNGLGGCSQGSAASFVATAAFMASAIAATFLIDAVIS